MKKMIGEFFGHFFSNPLLPLLVILCSVLAMMFTGDGHSSHLKAGEPEYIRAVVPLNVISDSESTSPAASSTTAAPSAQSTTAFTMTAASAAVTTEAVTTTTAAPAEETTSAESTTEADSAEETDEPRPERPQVSDYKVHVDADSENSAYYQSNLVILGDSIAYGFNAYGYIPNEHNVAAESMALWNMSRYSFNLGGGSMGAVDAAVYTDSPLIYISIGMNDILGTNPDDYASKVCGIAQQLVDILPDTTVIIGAITPIGPPSTYTTNDTIDSFNYAAESTVDAYGSPQILFFDANAVLKDPNTGALASNVSGGDGLHISGASYGYILNALFSYLDTTDTLDRMHQHDEKYE